METARKSRGSHGIVADPRGGQGRNHGRAGTGQDTPPGSRQVMQDQDALLEKTFSRNRSTSDRLTFAAGPTFGHEGVAR
jgi:hypothetical protein